MKQEIHPEYYSQAKVVCSCGEVFTTGSTKSELKVELCNKCHPFYTGEQRIVDTEGRVDRFMRKYGMGSLDNATSEAKPSNEESSKES